MDLARAESFVMEKGTPLEIARFAAVARGMPAPPGVVGPFLTLQNDDGGFLFGLVRGNPSSINDTHAALSWLDDLALLDAAVGRRAVAYLLAVRDDHGL